MNDLAILRKRQVEEMTGRSYASLRRDIGRGEFPKPVQIGPRAIGRRSGEVRGWIESRSPAALDAEFISGAGRFAVSRIERRA